MRAQGKIRPSPAAGMASRQSLMGVRKTSESPELKSREPVNRLDSPVRARMLKKQDRSVRNSFKGINAFRPNAGISKDELESLQSPMSRDAYFKPEKGSSFEKCGLRPVSVVSGGNSKLKLQDLQALIALEGEKIRQEDAALMAPRGIREDRSTRAPMMGAARSPSATRRAQGSPGKFKMVIQGSADSAAAKEQSRNRPQSIFLLNKGPRSPGSKRVQIGRRKAPRVVKASPRVSMLISSIQSTEDPQFKVKQLEDFFGSATRDFKTDEEDDMGKEDDDDDALFDEWDGELLVVKRPRSRSTGSITAMASYSVDADLIPKAVREKLTESSDGVIRVPLSRSRDAFDQLFADDEGKDTVQTRPSPTDMAPSPPSSLTDNQRSPSFSELPVPEDEDEDDDEVANASKQGVTQNKEQDVVYEKVQNGKQELLVIIGGTKEKLLENLVDVHFQDVDYINQVIRTHHYFCSSHDLLKYLCDSYIAAASTTTGTERSLKLLVLKKKRIMFILAKWIRTCADDLCGNKDARRLLRSFSKSSSVSVEHQKALARQIKLMKSTYRQTQKLQKKTMPQKKATAEANGQVKNVFQDRSADELARQICLAEHFVFSKISSAELRNKKWSDKDAETTAPNIHRTIQRFNEISFWVASEVVVLSDVRDRVKTLKKFIHIMERCISYQNFNAAMAILSGLNNGAVSRLKRTWKMMPPKYMEMFNNVTQLFSMEKSFKVYRSVLHSKSPPLLPYIGVNLKDLTFIEDGNPDFLDDSKRLINFEKYRMVASIITQLVSYQQRGYPFLPDPEIQYYLENMVILSEKQLYTYSQRVENRNTMANRRQSRLSMRITQSIVGAGFGSWRGGGRP